MKLVNPVGRSVGYNSIEITPKACMCGEAGGQFAGAKGGKKDTCLHCGCDCTKSDAGSGNKNTARFTIRKS
jgi:putative bacteriocin precursor